MFKTLALHEINPGPHSTYGSLSSEDLSAPIVVTQGPEHCQHDKVQAALHPAALTLNPQPG